MDIMHPFLFGCLGGIGAELLSWYKRRDGAIVAPTFTYIWSTVGMVLIGGGVAVAYTYDGRVLGAMLSMNIGATTPLLLGTWCKSPASVND